jgi:sugar lactone lactonase YvrE
MENPPLLSLKADLVLEAGAQLGEGPLWDARIGKLWWVDISACRLHRFDPGTLKDESFDVGQPLGAAVPEEGRELLLALEHGFARFEGGRVSPLASLPQHDPNLRLNDGKCDPAGRFWAGSTAYDGRPALGSLFCLERDLSVGVKLDSITCSNGLGWSPDQKEMYYIDSGSPRVMAYAYDAASGAIRTPRVAVEVPPAEGIPDGLSVDSEGNLWIALFNGGKVIHCDPRNGRRLGQISVAGARQTTCCAFGGPDLDTLYITSARENFSARDAQEQPLGGGLFSAKPGVRGLPPFAFKAGS